MSSAAERPAVPAGPSLRGFHISSRMAPKAEERSGRAVPTLAMTPMIDVVFLLIIFFMCSQFRTLEGELQAMLPPRAGVVPGARPVPISRAPTARIYISRAGRQVVYLLNDTPLAGRDDLLPALLDLKRAHPRLEVVLDGDDGLPFEHFLFAFDVCLQAGIGRINLVRPATPED